jgi:hypothetical protein
MIDIIGAHLPCCGTNSVRCGDEKRPRVERFGERSLRNFLLPPSGLVWELVAKENLSQKVSAQTSCIPDYPSNDDPSATWPSKWAAEEGTIGRDARADGTESSLETERICRFCYGEEDAGGSENSLEETPGSGKLVSPCDCVGTQAYVHQSCLNEW